MKPARVFGMALALAAFACNAILGNEAGSVADDDAAASSSGSSSAGPTGSSGLTSSGLGPDATTSASGGSSSGAEWLPQCPGNACSALELSPDGGPYRHVGATPDALYLHGGTQLIRVELDPASGEQVLSVPNALLDYGTDAAIPIEGTQSTVGAQGANDDAPAWTLRNGNALARCTAAGCTTAPASAHGIAAAPAGLAVLHQGEPNQIGLRFVRNADALDDSKPDYLLTLTGSSAEHYRLAANGSHIFVGSALSSKVVRLSYDPETGVLSSTRPLVLPTSSVDSLSALATHGQALLLAGACESGAAICSFTDSDLRSVLADTSARVLHMLAVDDTLFWSNDTETWRCTIARCDATRALLVAQGSRGFTSNAHKVYFAAGGIVYAMPRSAP